MDAGRCLRNNVFPYWKSIVVVLAPLILLPLAITGSQEASVAYVILIMASYWMTEALPLPVTSLIPVVAFPLLGVMDTGHVCMNYFTETVMMFIGGLVIGLAVEYCNLHQRIALRVILIVGTEPKWLLLGIMLVSMFLSMWVSNTGATAMIVPIVEALIQELFKEDRGNQTDEVHVSLTRGGDEPVSTASPTSPLRRYRRQHVTLLLAVAYAANIGGTATLIGSTPQLALKGILEDFYGTETGLSFTSWMAVNLPVVLINVFLTWIWFLLFMGEFWGQRREKMTHKLASKTVALKYQQLGPMTFHEKFILGLFLLLVSLWMFRDPKFIPGWSSFFSKKIGDSVPVIAVIIILFALPAVPNFWCFRSSTSASDQPKANKSMLSWNFVVTKTPWGLVLLLGSGFALSDASKISGLSKWLGMQLTVFQSLPKFAVLVAVCTMSAFMTEIVSNTATANIVLPILAEMAEGIHINPLYLMVPAAATCCYTFILPVGTPSNAIVYGSAKMNAIEMMKAGILTKLMCLLVLCAVMETLGVEIFPPDFILTMNFTKNESLAHGSNVTSL